MVGERGLVGLTDSPPKFQQIIGLLQQIDEEVQQKGFQDAGPAFLRSLYGKNLSYRALKLITAYEVCRKEERAATGAEEPADDVETGVATGVENGPGIEDAGTSDAEQAYNDAVDADKAAADLKAPIDYRAEFHKLMADEIDWFEERAARDRQSRAELEVPRTEAALELDEKSRVSLVNQERLERIFERKWKFLVRYRRNRFVQEGS
jgi:hypothetical protein